MSAATLSPKARRDLFAAADFIADHNPVAADALVDAVQAAASLIGNRSRTGSPRLHLLPLPFRFWRLARFPYLLIYNSERTPPEIVAILHTARDLPPLLRDIG